MNKRVTQRIGMQVPIMLRSKYCQLEDQTEHDLTTLGECPLDQARACSNLHRKSFHVLDGPLCSPRACNVSLGWQICILPCNFFAGLAPAPAARLLLLGSLGLVQGIILGEKSALP